MAEVEIIDKPENVLIVKAKELGVENDKALALCSAFQPFIDQAQEWAEQADSLVVTSAEDTKTMKECRSLRLNLKQVRVETEKKRKAMKEASLREGKAIDGMANIVKFLVVPIEERLQEQEDFAKLEREKKIARLQGERSAMLDDYDFDYSYIQLGEMAEEAFQGLLKTAKDAHEARVKAEQEAKAAAEAEAKRLREAEEKRQREEAERLAAEEAERQAALQADDDVKLKALIEHIQSIDLKSDDSRELLENIVLDINRFIEA